MTRRIIYGGSFDPIHNSHLNIMEKASIALNASLIVVPSKNPRWKNPTETIENRLEMLNLALQSEKFDYEISDFELKSNSDINYSIDTIKYLKNKYSNSNFE